MILMIRIIGNSQFLHFSNLVVISKNTPIKIIKLEHFPCNTHYNAVILGDCLGWKLEVFGVGFLFPLACIYRHAYSHLEKHAPENETHAV